jgi:hypothetical protein
MIGASFSWQRLEYSILVWSDRPLDDVFTQPPGGIDHHHVGKARFGVDREHHTGTGLVGPNHLLHTDGKSDFEMLKSVLLPIGDRAIGE